MIRSHENPLALRAGLLSLLVHSLLVTVLLISFNWKSVQPASVAQVELWDSLPTPVPAATPLPTPEPPKPPEPLPPEPKPEAAPEPKADIQLKKEPVQTVKPDPSTKARLEKQQKEKLKQEQIRQLQQALLADDKAVQKASEKKASQAATNMPASAASAGEINKYMSLINSKIHRYVNNQVCGTGKPQLTFSISLMPTGELIGEPRLTKGSGISACDDAVARAIQLAQPLPLPPEPDLFSQFRDLILNFRPNDDNQ